ncbi:GNAT family N-acetyltransferase [Planococcus antarcticus DSM 14505]|uniref:GNAT family N-acetyltransferase n=1 Tax=Planococcus antarcticus DSM 14505 TaxID=1185653 RepID=A0ABM6D8F3_9BACL|nr:GNAT family N-acetyltransferase [Planococcus antarcticus]ANU11771.1 GNAT family N-acetyltransferase [Planococcus antarcticus DSM 14505]
MLIREAKKNEFHLLKEQRLNSYMPYQEELSQKHWGLLKANLASDNDQQPGVEVFVAEIGGEIAGSVVLFPAASKAYDWKTDTIAYPEIRLLAVSPNFRSRGVGKALVEHCIDISKIRKQRFIGLHTGSFMINAIALYEKMGFERVASLDFTPLDDGIVVKAFRYNL